MKNLSVILAKLLPLLLATFLAGCAIEERAQRESLKDAYVRGSTKCYSCAFREAKWEGEWASLKEIRVYYSEPFLDNHELFERKWSEFRGDFAAWFGKHFEEVFIDNLSKMLQRWDAVVPNVKIEMKDDQFWKLESREMERVLSESSPRVFVDGVPLPRDSAATETDGLEIYITPVNVRTVDEGTSIRAIYRCRAVVVDVKSGNVILYENIEESGPLFIKRQHLDPLYGLPALDIMVRHLLSDMLP